jgi:hypothetical protein
MSEAKIADERLRGFLRKAGRNAESDRPKGQGYGSTSSMGEYEGEEGNVGTETPEVQCMYNQEGSAHQAINMPCFVYHIL